MYSLLFPDRILSAQQHHGLGSVLRHLLQVSVKTWKSVTAATSKNFNPQHNADPTHLLSISRCLGAICGQKRGKGTCLCKKKEICYYLWGENNNWFKSYKGDVFKSLTFRPAQKDEVISGGAASGSAWRAGYYLCVCVLVTGRVRGLLTSAPYFLQVLYNIS